MEDHKNVEQWRNLVLRLKNEDPELVASSCVNCSKNGASDLCYKD